MKKYLAKGMKGMLKAAQNTVTYAKGGSKQSDTSDQTTAAASQEETKQVET